MHTSQQAEGVNHGLFNLLPPSGVASLTHCGSVFLVDTIEGRRVYQIH